ncbi:MAG: hypothetical protein KDC95_24590, partial [Planctomycetes bacterium]|nr:hypothetical protein [Planctomycetota bacterium]
DAGDLVIDAAVCFDADSPEIRPLAEAGGSIAGDAVIIPPLSVCHARLVAPAVTEPILPLGD